MLPRCSALSRALCVLTLALLSWAAEPAPAQDAAPEWGPWWILLPIDHPDASIAKPHSPEDDLRAMKLDGLGPDLDREHRGKGGHKVSWFRLNPTSRPTAMPSAGHIRFAEHFPEGLSSAGLTDFAAAYLYRTIRAERDERVPITLGSDDGCRVWLNGELVHEFDAPRAVNPEDDKLVLELQAGVNHLFVKVANGGGAWGFQMIPRVDLVFTPEVRSELQPAINSAIDRGVEYLIKTQQRDGSWGYMQSGYRNGQTALSLYALLESGVRPHHQAIRRGFEYLRLRAPRKTYAAAVQILAISAANRSEDDEWIERIVEELIDWQQGVFGYPEGEKDLSCTQYGALGYWIAQRHGIKVPKRAWTDLARNLLRYHNDDGGFTYRPGGVSTGSMTVAGLTVIAVCREYFGDSGFPKQWRKPLERAHEKGLRWLAENFEVKHNPAPSDAARKRWKYYYLYGIERLAALLQVREFGEHDWYWEGAAHLIKAQGEQGNWGTAYGEPEPNTAFALLFLNRATATISGQGASAHQGRLYVTDGEDALVVLRAKGDTPISLWLSELRPALKESHKRKGALGEGIYLEAVEYFADGVSVARVEADSTKPWNSQPYAIQHTFAERGDHEVRLELHFAEVPGAEGGRPASVSSPVLKVRIDERLEDWMLDYVDDRASNLALGTRKQTSASSRRGDHGAGRAFDGYQSTAWICDKNDADPSISVEFKKPVRIDRLVLSHAIGTELQRGKFDRATKVEVDLGGKRDPLVFDVDPDEELKTTLVLPRKLKLTRLTVRVLERLPGSEFRGCVGFAEIELRLGDEKPKKRR